MRRLHWLSYHRAMIEDWSQYAIVEKSRRVGFDYAQAFKHTMARLTGKRDRHLWYTSSDESAAAEFIDYCAFFHGRVQAVVDRFVEDLSEVQDSKGAIKAFCIRFPNGGRINALSSSPRRLRSKGGDVLISEHAYHDDPAALYAAAQPVIMWGDTMTIGSTHNGEGSDFNHKCKEARLVAAGETHKGGQPLTPWRHFYAPITTAVDQGLVELINRERGTNFSRSEFLHNLRAGCATEDVWLQEYMCQPSTETTAWLSYDLIRSCESDDCPAIDEPLKVVPGDEARYAGIDVGRVKDLTVLTIFGKVGDVLHARRILSLSNMRIPDQINVLEGALREAKAQRTCVDATGIGLGLAEGLQDRFGEYAVESVTFTNPVKERLAVPVRARFEDRTVRIPDDGRLREGLHKIRKTVTAAGNVRFEAERDQAGHADEFWSVALAIEAAGEGDGVWVSVIE